MLGNLPSMDVVTPLFGTYTVIFLTSERGVFARVTGLPLGRGIAGFFLGWFWMGNDAHLNQVALKVGHSDTGRAILV